MNVVQKIYIHSGRHCCFLYYLYVTLVQHEGEINKKNTNMKNKTSGEKQDLCESVCVPVECIVKTNIEINCT